MPGAPFLPLWPEVVRRHFDATAGYVVAQTGQCLDVQRGETKPPRGRVPGRDFRPLRPSDLVRLRPPRSWFVGVILCPDDDVSLYVEWWQSLESKDRDRVVFFHTPEFASDAVDRVWRKAGLPLPRTQRFDGSWAAFHQLYGRRHGNRVYEDHAPPVRS